MIGFLALMLAAAPDQAAALAKAAPERKICRRYEETGARARFRRECRTAAEWAEIDDEQRTATTRMVEQTRLRTVAN